MSWLRATSGVPGFAACIVLGIGALTATVSGFGAVGDDSVVEAVYEAKLDLNTATREELMLLPGIGEKRAAAIIAYRERIGGFRRVSQLQRVHGIGERTVKGLESLVQIGHAAE